MVRLAELTGVELSVKQLTLLRIINRFNIRARYDDYKESFYKLATREYTKQYIENGNKLFLWIKKFIQKAK